MRSDLSIPPVYKRGAGVLQDVGKFCKTRANNVFIIR